MASVLTTVPFIASQAGAVCLGLGCWSGLFFLAKLTTSPFPVAMAH